jgi:hypothetical protein
MESRGVRNSYPVNPEKMRRSGFAGTARELSRDQKGKNTQKMGCRRIKTL